MLKCYKSNIHTQALDRPNEILPDSWIDLSQPTDEEIDRVADMLRCWTTTNYRA